MDLAGTPGRSGQQQGRRTNNRDTLLPRARQTDLPKLEVNADVRYGRVGTGAADALLKSLNLANDTVQQVGRQYTAELTEAEEKYRRWQAQAKGVEAVSQARRAARDGLNELLNAEQDADGDGDFDLLDVDALIDQRYASVVMGPDGKPKDYGDPEVSFGVASELTKDREELREEFHGIVRERTISKDLAKAVLLFDGVPKGGAYELDAFITSLPPNVPRERGLKEAIPAIVANAKLTGNEEGLKGLLKGTRADGKTPLLGAEYRDVVTSALDQVIGQNEALAVKQQNERREAKENQLFATFSTSGALPSRAEIARMVTSGEIDRGFGATLIGEHEERVRAAKAEASAAEAAAQRAHNGNVEVRLAELGIMWKTGNGPTDLRSFHAEVDKLRRSGGLGAGNAYGSNLNSLYSAYKEGVGVVLRNPQAALMGKQVALAFPAPKQGSVVGALGGSNVNVGRIVALQAYTSHLLARKSPAEAYTLALKAGREAQAPQKAPAQTGLNSTEAAELAALRAKNGR